MNFFPLLSCSLLFVSVFFIQKFGRKIRDAVEAAKEKYPADPSVVIMTEEKLRSLEETLVWRWVGLIFFLLNSRHFLWTYVVLISVITPFFLCSKFATELQRMINTAVGTFISVDEE